LSGELDRAVDALITCVTPIDGTRSRRHCSLSEYVSSLADRFKNVNYCVNGKGVIDGEVLSWVYRIRNASSEAPLAALVRDLEFVGSKGAIPVTAAAVNRWLMHDRKNQPIEITKASLLSYTHPISKAGALPLRLFDRELNLGLIPERGISWLLCVAEKDDLVDRDVALAPLDYIRPEVTVFPKGHAAIATSWSNPGSACPLDGEFELQGRMQRGPVRFHLDLEQTQPDTPGTRR
jgi:hypothetical protein